MANPDSIDLAGGFWNLPGDWRPPYFVGSPCLFFQSGHGTLKGVNICQHDGFQLTRQTANECSHLDIDQNQLGVT